MTVDVGGKDGRLTVRGDRGLHHVEGVLDGESGDRVLPDRLAPTVLRRHDLAVEEHRVSVRRRHDDRHEVIEEKPQLSNKMRTMKIIETHFVKSDIDDITTVVGPVDVALKYSIGTADIFTVSLTKI